LAVCLGSAKEGSTYKKKKCIRFIKQLVMWFLFDAFWAKGSLPLSEKLSFY